MNILRGSVVGLSGLVGVGVLAWPSVTTAASADSDEVYKRDERITELALVADDDDDDTNDNTNNTNTGASRATNDNTRSNFTGVSRDRDLSRGDKTRDWTRDGGDRTRDRSAGQTNDRSRNDTRR
ncbi:hypothetical protein G7072_05885 [Nocardioides sp. HDW12B]|uniref:hypothetical protein n=1 Tax=Nocardioides sp. HDW12B TaxID=2714939 RepID=UPI00140B7607|nr:hypothetical protein [Nocardioides sp. HDW12B]QIK65928.1 hypothetical protein G7072_05885 [Nocardioides sp. HDW12B]